MTEAEWLNYDHDSQAMIEQLTRMGKARGKCGHRKLRLFVCGCCRRVWGLLPDERCRNAVAVGERFADGSATTGDLAAARAEAAWVVCELESAKKVVTYGEEWCHLYKRTHAAEAVHAATLTDSVYAAKRTADAARWADFSSDPRELLRDIFGNPFRPAVAAPTILACKGGLAPTLARALYDDHRLEDLPILADVLEEAGCDNADLLSHLRGPGPHARGCWALDLILANE
jgi:hypothetical protein